MVSGLRRLLFGDPPPLSRILGAYLGVVVTPVSALVERAQTNRDNSYVVLAVWLST